MRRVVFTTLSLKEFSLKHPEPLQESSLRRWIWIISPATVDYLRVCSVNNPFHRRRPRPPLKVLLVEAFRILVDAAIDLLEDAWIDLVMSLFIALL